MNKDHLNQPHTERITEWITGGDYAVAVEVEATIYPNRLDSPCLSRETVQFLEEVARNAEAGDLEALKRAGNVFVRLRDPASLATAGAHNGGQISKRAEVS